MIVAFELLRRWWPALAIAALLGLSHWYVYERGVTVTNSTWGARWTARDAEDAKAQAEAESAARTREQQMAQAAERVQRDAEQALEQSRLDAAGATAAADRLRDELAKLQSRLRGTSTSPGVTVSSTSATRAAMVLSELYGSCQSRLGELSGAFDRARIAGLACEASYDGLRKSQ